jgi:A/G-specific adenine glycosylase
MELGALVCTPKEPTCQLCPLSRLCKARRLGIVDRVPVTTPKRAPETVTEAGMVISRAGRVLIVQRGFGGLWEQFWEFPTVHLEGVDPAGRSLGPGVDLAEAVRRFTGIAVRVGPPVKTIAYSVTNHRVKLIVHLAEVLSGSLAPGPGLVDIRWAEPARLGEFTFSAAGRRLIAWINQGPHRPSLAQ